MSLRKNRIACQGVNNLSQIDIIANKSAPFMKSSIKNFTSSINLSKTMNEDHSSSKYLSPDMKLTTEHNWNGSIDGNKAGENLKMTRSGNFWTEKQTRKVPNLLCSKEKKTPSNDTIPQKLQPSLDKIRNLYKQNSNIKKIVKAWGFESNGCISANQFQQMINQHLDPSVTKEDCQELFEKNSGQKQSLDLLSFMKVLFDQEPFTKPRINVLDPMLKNPGEEKDELSKTLVKKIHQLNESSLLKEINKNADNLKSSFSDLKNSRSSEHLKKLTSTFSSTALRTFEKTQPSLHQTLWSESSPKYQFFTTKSHATEFLPTQYYGKNQQKTRFGATPPISLNNQSFAENKRQKIVDEKMKVMKDLQKERTLQQMRYENRIDKIRQHQQIQKENVMRTNKKAQERDLANIKRRKEENVAYNYVNFIHNNWK